MPLTLSDVNIGAAPDDGTGDPARTAFSTINSNNALIETEFTGVMYLDGTQDMTAEFGTDVGTFRSDVADGASAVGFKLNTANAFATSGGKLLSVQNAAAERFSVAFEGSTEIRLGGRNNNFYFRIYDDLSTLVFSATGGGNVTATGVLKGTVCEVTGTPTATNNTLLGRESFNLSRTAAPFTIQKTSQNSDSATNNLSIVGQHAFASATTNLAGGGINILGGDGASGSAGDADGGDVTIKGGTGYGTGSVGNIIMNALPTADPAVAGALWNNSGVLNVSAG